jgi:hypothetical protein
MKFIARKSPVGHKESFANGSFASVRCSQSLQESAQMIALSRTKKLMAMAGVVGPQPT